MRNIYDNIGDKIMELYMTNSGTFAYGQMDDDRWYIRPIQWHGYWAEDGKLDHFCNVLESFDTKDECAQYINTHDFSQDNIPNLRDTITYKNITYGILSAPNNDEFNKFQYDEHNLDGKTSDYIQGYTDGFAKANRRWN